MFTLSRSKVFFHFSSGNTNLTGASSLIVANVFEKIASSSPSIKRFFILGVTPVTVKLSFSFFSFLYIPSIVPQSRIRFVAVLAPIPFIPTMLSDGSPASPL